MIDMSEWLGHFLLGLKDSFGDRLFFVGLQGSYARGEATEKSDIDVVVILDELSPRDLETYGTFLDTLSPRELICGFLAGKEELFHWEPSDLFTFYYDTKPLLGSLDELLPLLEKEALERSIRIGSCNVYHGCVHNLLHEKSEELLAGLYKTAVFVIRACAFRKTGRYLCETGALCEVISPQDRTVFETFLYLKAGGTVELVPMSEILFVWAQEKITKES